MSAASTLEWDWSTWLTSVGQWQGVSDWLDVPQAQVDRFAELTGDHQYIHVDPLRAAATPLGGTVAHGFLTLALLAPLAAQVLPQVRGAHMLINYGFERVRFITPVRCGRCIRASFRLQDAREEAPGRRRLQWAVEIEVEGESRPAVVADWLLLSLD